ncbi:cytochrome b [Phenylobacterium sp.]|uniref:cytochrome b n=1 Tax=Phenylobacterium sp. TaxID=1871053 RepID=UPI001225AF7B|nr:cytochrome b [Phenylobacterium sp.]THD58321.1 MAG: cytochrome b [Phenylobacterium sp.]
MNALVPVTSPAAEAEAPPSPPARFDAISMTLHWASLVLIAWLFLSAWSIGLAGDAEGARMALTVHRSLGATMWVLALARLTWRLRFAVRPPFPDGMPRPQRRAALAVEAALYLILLVQPLTGLGQSLTRGKPFELFAFEVPKLMARDKAATGLLHSFHEATAFALLGLIALHVAAALFHGFVRRDGVLRSMWPASLTPTSKPRR